MLKQTLQQKLLQKLSPQQIQLMKLLQVPTVALEQRIKEELESNPALEEGLEESEKEYEQEEYEEGQELSEAEQEFDFSDYMDDEPSYKYKANNYSADDEDHESPLSVGSSFRERLIQQLDVVSMSKDDYEIAQHLIGSLDDAGYLRRDLYAVMDDLAFTRNIETDMETLERLLGVIQGFEPAGVGARNLQECLVLQLKAKKERSLEWRIALAIVEDYFDAFTKKHYAKIIDQLEIKEEDLKAAMEVVVKLNPKPGNSSNDGNSARLRQHIIPDFKLAIEDGKPQLSLNGRNAPDLKVSRRFREMIETYQANKGKVSKQDKEAMLFVKQKLDGAKWFIDAIKQRQQTMYVVMNAILEIQEDYFLEGDITELKPMILKDVAEKVNMDISTISRVANSKYIETPFGTFLLKEFFSESLSTTDGEEVSTREVKKILTDLIDAEDKRKPLTDEKLAKHLKEKGYNIARRTVAKYREQLNLPVARLRKEI